MDILKPEDQTLNLLAAELGFIVLDERTDQPRPQTAKNTEKQKVVILPALQKPFSQLT